MTRTFAASLSHERFTTEDVGHFRLVHRLGVPSRAVVDLILPEEVPLDDLVGSSCLFAFGYLGEEWHRFPSVVESAEIISRGTTQVLGEANVGHRLYLVSRVGVLARSRDSVIRQEMTIEELVTDVLVQHGFDSKQLLFRLSESRPRREVTVQYQEDALSFMSRLLEADGISYFVELDQNQQERMVFFDDSTHADPLEPNSELEVRTASQLHGEVDVVLSVDRRRRQVPTRVTLRDFNWKTPKLSLEAIGEGEEASNRELYDYPGGFADLSDGRRLATTRHEAEQAESYRLGLVADCPTLMVGKHLTLQELSGRAELFVVEVVHECVFWERQEAAPEHARPVDYAARAEAQPLDLKYRPRRVHRAPRLVGPQTATIVAPAGAPAEEIHTDEHGRCKVRFHWDRAGIDDDRASAWIRTTQLQTSGSMILPRVGWEVLVEFENGDPDRPFVTGRLYNGATMPPYTLPAGATRTSIKTNSSPGGGGTNEIRFEDKAGSEEIMIGSQYNTSIAVANNRTTSVGSNETQTIGADCSLTVGANQDLTITQGHKCSIGASQSVTVGANRSVEVNAVTGLTVAGSATTTVGGMQFEMNGSPLAGLIAIAKAKAAELIEAKVNAAIEQVQGQIQGKVDQVMGPINEFTSQVESVGGAMQALADGDLSAMVPLAQQAGAISDGDAVMANVGFSLAAGGEISGESKEYAFDDPTGLIAATQGVNAAISDQIGGAAGAAKGLASDLIGDLFGQEAQGGGGGSMANRSGPDGAVDGVTEADKATGPGHAMYSIAASHTETTGAVRVSASLQSLDLKVGGSMNQTIGAALVEVARGDFAEQTGGSKTETEPLFGVFAKGSESESSEAAINNMVGGAVIDKITGDQTITASGPATFMGALHKIDAKTKITLKCGASSVVIDGSGITITSIMVDFLGAAIKLTKPTHEN